MHSNVQYLVEKASVALAPQSAMLDRNAKETRVEPLIRTCLRSISTEDANYLPPHLQDSYASGYTCASCQAYMLIGDEQYLPSSLVERMVLFNPPVNINSGEQTIRKTGYMIGGSSWRFCASCLIQHSVSTAGCECMVCKEERKALANEQGVRWARKRLQ